MKKRKIKEEVMKSLRKILKNKEVEHIYVSIKFKRGKETNISLNKYEKSFDVTNITHITKKIIYNLNGKNIKEVKDEKILDF